MGGVKQGRFVIFAFSLVLQYFGVPNYPEAEENSTKSVVVCAPQMSARLGLKLRVVSPSASRQSTGKLTNRLHRHDARPWPHPITETKMEIDAGVLLTKVTHYGSFGLIRDRKKHTHHFGGRSDSNHHLFTVISNLTIRIARPKTVRIAASLGATKGGRQKEFDHCFWVFGTLL